MIAVVSASIKLSYDKNAYFWLEVRNETDLTITSITAEVEMFDASQSGSPALPINKKNGKITVPKGTKKGTYTVKIKVTAAGDATTAKLVRTVSVKITVK